MKLCSLCMTAFSGAAVVSAANIAVPPGGDLQAALNSARSGDTVILTAGATYIGHFTLPPNPGPAPITVQSSALDQLPGPGQRVDKSQAWLMPKLVTPDSAAVLVIAGGANYYRFVGVEFAVTPGVYTTDLIRAGLGTETSAADLPHDLVFDRDYIHGDAGGAGGHRGIALNGGATTVENCYLEGFTSNGQDTQALDGWNGPGPFTITNNYLSAGTEIVGFGGAPVAIYGQHPSNITISNNYFYRDPAWRSAGYWVKNDIELKDAVNVTIDSNIMENNWSDAGIAGDPAPQRGFSLVFTVRADNDGEPWAAIQNVAVTNNIIRHSGGGINFSGHDDDGSGSNGNFTVQNNLWEDISSNWGYGYLFQILNSVQNLLIDHNTAFQTGYFAVFSPPASMNVVFTNNLAQAGPGVAGEGTPTANMTLATFDPGGFFSGNVLIGGDPSQYPANNYFPATLGLVGFVDAVDGNFQLLPTSLYINVGTDGSAVGVNAQKLPGSPGAPAPPATPAPPSAPSGGGDSGFPAPGVWYNLISRNSGQCLDVISTPATNGGLLQGTWVQQWTCWGGAMQKWQFTPVSGGYEITNQNSGMQLDVAGGPAATMDVDGSGVLQWPYWGGTNEIWQVTPTGDGYYEIQPVNSGGNECLDVISTAETNYAQNPGTRAQQYACWGGPMQQWAIVPAQ